MVITMRKLKQEEFIERAMRAAKRPVDLSLYVYSGTTKSSTAMCPIHGPFKVKAGTLLRGDGCRKCVGKECGERQTHTRDKFIEMAIKAHGNKYDYSLVEYRGAKFKVAIQCPVHGIFHQIANQHVLGKGCKKCACEKHGKNCRITQDEFLSEARKRHGDRYDLSEVVYQGRTKKIKVICKEHGPFYPQAGNFGYLGSGCPECGRELNGSKRRRKEISYIAEGARVHKGRYSYGKVTRKNGVAMMWVICKVHGRYLQNAQDHLKGIGCMKCARPLRDQGTFMERAREVHGDKYDYSKVEYTKALNKVTIICPTHGEFEQTPSSHISAAQGCPMCAKVGPSTGQLEVHEFLNHHLPAELEHGFDETRRSLDVFIPEKNIAVEYHGLIWHSTAFAKDPLHDYKKHLDAAKLGIRVIHIYEDEWEKKRPIVERLLLSAIGNAPRIFARYTSVVDVDAGTAKKFLDENHIQGCTQRSSCYIGLQHEGRLVACMAFSPSRSIRYNTDNRLWELQRYASETSVVGGASKLLKAFLKRRLCHTLVSYSDNRLFTGGMYTALGFELEHETDPDYCYISNNSRAGRIHKANFQRKHLPSRLEHFDPDKTEVENCADHGWYQLFDCGKKKWTLKCE